MNCKELTIRLGSMMLVSPKNARALNVFYTLWRARVRTERNG